MDDWGLMELDILKEVGTIAASNGTDALTKMLNRAITVNLPTVVAINDRHEIVKGAGDSDMISIRCDILAGLHGRVLLSFDDKSALRFLELCYPGYPVIENNQLTELGLSALREVGNVVVSAYVNALSVFLRSVVVPSPPSLMVGSLETIINEALASGGKIYVLLIDTVFEKEHESIRGRIEFLLTKEDKELLRKSCMNSLDKDASATSSIFNAEMNSRDPITGE